MTLIEIVEWVVIVFLADLSASLLVARWNARKKPAINCDNCARPMLLRQTADKKFWLCKTCRSAYQREQRAQQEAS